MNPETNQLQQLVVGMRQAYARGDNAMAYARAAAGSPTNATIATLIAYDLQAGSYNAQVRRDPATNRRWCEQIAGILAPFLRTEDTVLEAGCGEATTLAGMLGALPERPTRVLGFDLSWSRCAEGLSYLASRNIAAELFVGDLFRIPLADASVDVVYTSHTLEPNGGREEAALRELLRVTRRTLVLVEPIYELADSTVQARMREHGYVRGLYDTLQRLGMSPVRCELLPFCNSSRNPSGIIVVHKQVEENPGPVRFQCPLTCTPLRVEGDVYVSDLTGLVYPVLREIPLLRPEHAIVASRIVQREARHEL